MKRVLTTVLTAAVLLVTGGCGGSGGDGKSTTPAQAPSATVTTGM